MAASANRQRSLPESSLRFRGSLRARVSPCRTLFCTIPSVAVTLGRGFLRRLFLGEELFLQRIEQFLDLIEPDWFLQNGDRSGIHQIGDRPARDENDARV